MLDFFQIKQHRIVFSILAILVGLVLIIMVTSGVLMFLGKTKSENGNANNNLIYFSGEGKLYTKPDTAFADFSVVTEGSDINNVQEANTKKMNKVIAFLKDSGIDEKDIKTTNYNLYPQYTYEESKTPQISGYQINQMLSIKIRDLNKVGEILKGVVKTGVNQISTLYFGVENDEQLKEQAREMAIKDAKKKAEKSASQIGIKLGKIIGFSESTNGYPVPIYKGEYGVGGGGGTPDIQTGENEIVVNVTLTYEIK